MESSSSSNSYFSVGPTSPSAVVLLYSVGAQGKEAQSGAARDSTPFSQSLFLRPTTLAQKSWPLGSRGGVSWLDWFPGQQCIAVCLCVHAFGSFYGLWFLWFLSTCSFSFFLSGPGPSESSWTREWGMRIGVSPSLARACRATFWANLRNLRVWPVLR